MEQSWPCGCSAQLNLWPFVSKERKGFFSEISPLAATFRCDAFYCGDSNRIQLFVCTFSTEVQRVTQPGARGVWVCMRWSLLLMTPCCKIIRGTCYWAREEVVWIDSWEEVVAGASQATVGHKNRLLTRGRLRPACTHSRFSILLNVNGNWWHLQLISWFLLSFTATVGDIMGCTWQEMKLTEVLLVCQ